MVALIVSDIRFNNFQKSIEYTTEKQFIKQK